MFTASNPHGRRATRHGSAGITLIEALIALLVLSLGMLALVQVQSTLRYNSDVAKQRSEAVRIAQENMESLRAYGRLAATTGYKSYTEIASSGPTNVTGITTNTRYDYSSITGVYGLFVPDAGDAGAPTKYLHIYPRTMSEMVLK